jgi:hypothetical protein
MIEEIKKENLVFTVTNNAVHDFETYTDSTKAKKTMDGVKKFLDSNRYGRPVGYVSVGIVLACIRA